MNSDLTFAVCAYKDSPFLEEAVKSAANQTYPVKLLIATSTPSAYIEEIARRHHAEYCVNPVKAGIASDWNFALSCAHTPFVTIIHQDDVYLPKYAQQVCELLQKHPETLIVFTDYGDLLPDGKIHPDRFYLRIKRLLLWAFYLKHIHTSRLWKRSAVAFGNAVSCPTVTYNMNMLGNEKFSREYSVNLDWDMWLRLTDLKGAFAFIPQVLMAHRIADAMETAAAIADHRRENEDHALFTRIWGGKLASLLMKFYRYSYQGNKNNT